MTRPLVLGVVELLSNPQSESMLALAHYHRHRSSETCPECHIGRKVLNEKLGGDWLDGETQRRRLPPQVLTEANDELPSNY